MVFLISQKKVLHFWRKGCRSFLAFFWILGWVFGIWTASESELDCRFWMYGIFDSSISILSLLFFSFLPFLISIFLVLQNTSYLLPLIAFGKAFILAIVSFFVLITYGSAGWLIGSLYLFSDLCLLPVLFFFWSRYVSGKRVPSSWEITGYCVWAIFVSSIDLCIISPFGASLIDF